MSDAPNLCLKCGLCCNGVIFSDGQLQPGDDPERLRELGLKLKATRGGPPKFHQPCAAFDGCRCRIYGERPNYCRKFECALLKRLNSRELAPAQALRTVAKAKQRAARVLRLMRELGDSDEATALSVRFRRLSKRMHTADLDKEKAHLFGELTIAVHELNVILSTKFYPGE